MRNNFNIWLTGYISDLRLLHDLSERQLQEKLSQGNREVKLIPLLTSAVSVAYPPSNDFVLSLLFFDVT